MRIVCISQRATIDVKRILAYYGLYERDGYLTHRPDNESIVTIAVWGNPPQELREALQGIANTTIQDEL
jgi:hypothetical protein